MVVVAPGEEHVASDVDALESGSKQRRGDATRALAQMLRLARDEGLAFVAVPTDPENLASQRVG